MSTVTSTQSRRSGIALSTAIGALGMLLVLFAEGLRNALSRVPLEVMANIRIPSLVLLYIVAGALIGALLTPLVRPGRDRPAVVLLASGAIGLAAGFMFFWHWNRAYFPAIFRTELLLPDLAALAIGVGVASLLRRLMGRRSALLMSAATLILALALPAAGWWANRGNEVQLPIVIASPLTRSPDVLLITIDTLRASNIGAYGYARARTPHIDRLAREGVLFADAYTPVPQTGPSHASILTGLHPTKHGVRFNGWQLKENLVTLAEILKSHGYQTFGAVSVEHLTSPFGFAAGFDYFVDHNPIFDRFYTAGSSFHLRFSLVEMIRTNTLRSTAAAWFNPGSHQRRGDRTVDLLFEQLKLRSGKPCFLWLHLFDPHTPYESPPGYAEQFHKIDVELPETPFPVERTRRRFDNYDGEVAFTDEQVGRVLAALEKDSSDLLVIFVADHGESLGEGGYVGHSGHVRQESVRVPLILRWPGVLPAGSVEEGRVFTMDILPTVLDLLGLPLPVEVDGRNMFEKGPERPLFLQSRSPGGFVLHGVLEGDLKVFATRPNRSSVVDKRTGRRGAYDLSRDENEKINLFKHPDRPETLSRALALLAKGERFFEAAPAEPQTIDASARRALKALGYIQ